MEDEDFWIPRELDAPPLFFIWEADGAIIFIVCLLLGAMLNMFVAGLVIAFIIVKGWAYLKDEGGRGLLMKFLYWYTPSDIWLTKKLPSHIREYIGG